MPPGVFYFGLKFLLFGLQIFSQLKFVLYYYEKITIEVIF